MTLFFQASLCSLASLPIYHQYTAHVPPPPIFKFLEKFCIFSLVLAKISALKMQIFQFEFPRPLIFQGNQCGTHPPKKMSAPLPRVLSKRSLNLRLHLYISGYINDHFGPYIQRLRKWVLPNWIRLFLPPLDYTKNWGWAPSRVRLSSGSIRHCWFFRLQRREKCKEICEIKPLVVKRLEKCLAFYVLPSFGLPECQQPRCEDTQVVK